MARREFAIGLVLSLAAVLSTRSSWAQPIQIPNCPPPPTNSISPCISYIIGNSSYPSSACCKQLKSLAQQQGPCVCAVLRGGVAATPLGYIFNQTQAYLLPSTCNLPTLNQCNGVSGPSSAPATPATTTASSPAAPSTPTDPNTSTPSTTSSTPSTPSEDSSNVTPTPASSLPSGIGFKTVPTAGSSSAAAGSSKLAPLLFFFALFVASCGSTFSGF